jgi:hypothetical protein
MGSIHERPASWPPVTSPPSTRAEWEALRGESPAALLARGCTSWDGALMLFPREWYDAIPEGFKVKTISGAWRLFRHDLTDDDARYGALACGVEVAT